MPANHRLDDLAHDPLVQRCVDERTRRERAHPAGIRSAVVVEDPLVILRGADRQRRGRRRRRRRTTLPARSGTLRSRAVRRRRRTAARSSPSRDRGFGLLRGRAAITTPLPAARPSAFSTTGKPNSPDRDASPALPSTSSQVEPRGRHAMPRHEGLRERLARLEARGRRGRAEQRAGRARRNDRRRPGSSGSSGPTTVRSTCSRSASSSSSSGRDEIDRNESREAAMPGLPGRTEARRRRVRPPGERPARARARRCRRPELSWLERLTKTSRIGTGPEHGGSISLTLTRVYA